MTIKTQKLEGNSASVAEYAQALNLKQSPSHRREVAWVYRIFNPVTNELFQLNVKINEKKKKLHFERPVIVTRLR